MKQLKIALCSALLLSSVVATAADKRVITMAPVSSTGYMIYNLGLNLILKKDLSQIPPGVPLPPEMQEFMASYDVANVVFPSRPAFNGLVSFDITRTESGKGLGHYEFYQTYSPATSTVTLRVLQSPVPSIPFVVTEGAGYISEMIVLEDENAGN